mgnify:CR=1 FL=1
MHVETNDERSSFTPGRGSGISSLMTPRVNNLVRFPGDRHFLLPLKDAVDMAIGEPLLVAGLRFEVHTLITSTAPLGIHSLDRATAELRRLRNTVRTSAILRVDSSRSEMIHHRL